MDASIGFIESEAIYGSGIIELVLKNNRYEIYYMPLKDSETKEIQKKS